MFNGQNAWTIRSTNSIVSFGVGYHTP